MRLFLLLLILLLTMSCVSTQKTDSNKESYKSAKMMMKNIGFAYCLNNFPEKEKNISKKKNKKEDIIASTKNNKYALTDADFNEDKRINPEAYIAIREYIKNNVEIRSFKNREGVNTLPSCLEIYNSAGYNAIIKQQEKYIQIKY